MKTLVALVVSFGVATMNLLVACRSVSAQPCVADCNADGRVTVDEVILGVDIALGAAVLDTCPRLDTNVDGVVAVDDLLTAVNNLLEPWTTAHVDVGGHALLIRCVGDGTPVVVLEAGGGRTLLDWRPVQSDVGKVTRTCAYNRAGYAGSDPGPLPRDATQIAAELAALLANSCLPGPYVLAGHSYGGQIIHLYASTHPQDVGGLVFVDARSEYFYGRVSALFPDTYATWLDANPCPDLSTGSGQECAGIDVSDAELQAAPPLPDVPTVAFVAGHAPEPSGLPFTSEQLQQVDALWLQSNADLTHRVSHGTLSVVPECGHFIQLCRPDLIVDAIRDIVETVRMQQSNDPPGR